MVRRALEGGPTSTVAPARRPARCAPRTRGIVADARGDASLSGARHRRAVPRDQHTPSRASSPDPSERRQRHALRRTLAHRRPRDPHQRHLPAGDEHQQPARARRGPGARALARARGRERRPERPRRRAPPARAGRRRDAQPAAPARAPRDLRRDGRLRDGDARLAPRRGAVAGRDAGVALRRRGARDGGRRDRRRGRGVGGEPARARHAHRGGHAPGAGGRPAGALPVARRGRARAVNATLPTHFPRPVTARPYILAETTWKTVRETRYEVAVLPWGATEAHNFHLPYATDTIQCDALAAESARVAWEAGARVVVLPTVPFGVQTTQLDIPLCLNMNP